MKHHLLTALILMILFLPALSHGKEKSIRILYTGGMEGELEPCGCSPKTDFGGLARFSGYINGHEDELSPYVLIDSGNFTDKDSSQGKLKAEAFLRAFSIMDYDAVAFMKNENRFPDDFFPPLLQELELPVLARMNAYQESTTITRGNLEINISVNPEALQKGKLNILLTDLRVAECEKISEWDVIITSSGEVSEQPVKPDETIIVAGYPEGKKMGILTLEIENNSVLQNFSHKWHQPGSDINEDPEIRDVLNDYNKRVARLLKESRNPPADRTYLGVSKCAECHQLFEESWEDTGHAAAFSSLEQAGKSYDPECLVCHTVGFGEKGGFYSIDATPDLANVQCESCHGLNKEHIIDFSKPMKRVTEQVCLECHTSGQSPDFDYPVYRDKIKHWQ